MTDVIVAFAQETEPREKSILVAIACHPNSPIEDLAALTGMSVRATREGLRCLAKQGHVFITITGGYLTATASVESA